MESADLRRLLSFLLPALVVGMLVNQLTLSLVISLGLYVVFFHLKIRRTLKWIKNRREDFPTNLGNAPDALDNVILAVSEMRGRHRSRKRQLRSILKEFRQATKALPDAVIAIDMENYIRWANKAAVRFLGIKIPEDVGSRVTNMVREPLLRELLQTKGKNFNTVQIRSPVDPRVVLSLVSAPYGKNQRLIVGRDITAIEEAIESRTDFVANVSHELRTPLTVFKGYIETLLSQDKRTPKSWTKPMEEMQRQAERMSRLVEELLLLSKLESEEKISDLQIVEPSKLIAQAHRRAMLLTNGKSHLFSLELDENLRLYGAENELYILFSNIIFNAVRYTDRESGVINIKWQKTGEGNLQFQVKDNGIGIAAEHLPRITERFYRVDESRQRKIGEEFSSTGLGLALVKHVMQRHNGSLDINSELGTGSVFTITFPEAQGLEEVNLRVEPVDIKTTV